MVERFDGLSTPAEELAATRDPYALLETEAEAMLTRLDRVKPFVLQETMVPAAAISPRAQNLVDCSLIAGRRILRARVQDHLAWLRSGAGGASAARAQQAFVILRLEFNDVLSQYDLFSEVFTQRSEHDTGVWLAGLDVAAADALRVAVPGFTPPEVMCYLDRGPGAAIRRARTRLPGGAENPVAIVRVPRERMIGSGIASSLVHEVGHQGAALLCLVESLRDDVRSRLRGVPPGERVAWALWDRWISEIVADFWSVAHVGVGSTLGLMQVVSLPRAFVFRVAVDDPHPAPWLRVLLSAAIGARLYPHPQWERLATLWAQLYPLHELDAERVGVFDRLRATIPELVEVLASHESDALRGRTLADVMPVRERQPRRLAQIPISWRSDPNEVSRAAPALALAVIGQAKADGTLPTQDEGPLLSRLLRQWAFERSLRQDSTGGFCGPAPGANAVGRSMVGLV